MRSKIGRSKIGERVYLARSAQMVLASWVLALIAGCSKKATRSECDELIERYATLLVSEQNPEASPAVVAAERDRARKQARADDDFKNCTTEVEAKDYHCAKAAKTAETLLKCLE
jgi:hypothetical protein